ncbi:hypothetical protein E2C01_002509 [Portunus trituberculatus]|uniref:Uncharacterized protein n=1 Tax=Portunus trituberculatus TaxID=210409 RepID=A0A5B7CM84_PORTR|nr:hypothetical protein [Portunus trituberculatus]
MGLHDMTDRTGVSVHAVPLGVTHHHHIGQDSPPCQFQEKLQHNSCEMCDSSSSRFNLRVRGANHIPIHRSGQGGQGKI